MVTVYRLVIIPTLVSCRHKLVFVGFFVLTLMLQTVAFHPHLIRVVIFQACLVGIVVPDPDFLPMWAKKKGFEGSYSELYTNKVRVITGNNMKLQLCSSEMPNIFFWLSLGCEGGHFGGHAEFGQRSRTQVF